MLIKRQKAGDAAHCAVDLDGVGCILFLEKTRTKDCGGWGFSFASMPNKLSFG